jgi:hypothetical protein
MEFALDKMAITKEQLLTLLRMNEDNVATPNTRKARSIVRLALVDAITTDVEIAARFVELTIEMMTRIPDQIDFCIALVSVGYLLAHVPPTGESLDNMEVPYAKQ